MNDAQKEDAIAYGADRTAKSRALKALRKSDEYQQMTDEEKEMAESIALAELQEKR